MTVISPTFQKKSQAPSSSLVVRACALVAWAFLILSVMTNAGCAGVGAEIKADAKNAGVDTAKCFWKCGLGCAATLVPIPNPPPEMPEEQ